MKDIRSKSLNSFLKILSDTDPFDWYQRFDGIKDEISKFFNTGSRILNVGAGNSSSFKILHVYQSSVE